MATILSESTPVARKEYPCGAYHWYCWAGLGQEEFEPADWDVIQKVDADEGSIKPGMRYIKQVQIDAGEISVYRARQDMTAICDKYNLWPEE